MFPLVAESDGKVHTHWLQHLRNRVVELDEVLGQLESRPHLESRCCRRGVRPEEGCDDSRADGEAQVVDRDRLTAALCGYSDRSNRGVLRCEWTEATTSPPKASEEAIVAPPATSLGERSSCSRLLGQRWVPFGRATLLPLI